MRFTRGKNLESMPLPQIQQPCGLIDFRTGQSPARNGATAGPLPRSKCGICLKLGPQMGRRVEQDPAALTRTNGKPSLRTRFHPPVTRPDKTADIAKAIPLRKTA